jgi:hypothetical protein
LEGDKGEAHDNSVLRLALRIARSKFIRYCCTTCILLLEDIPFVALNSRLLYASGIVGNELPVISTMWSLVSIGKKLDVPLKAYVAFKSYVTMQKVVGEVHKGVVDELMVSGHHDTSPAAEVTVRGDGGRMDPAAVRDKGNEVTSIVSKIDRLQSYLQAVSLPRVKSTKIRSNKVSMDPSLATIRNGEDAVVRYLEDFDSNMNVALGGTGQHDLIVTMINQRMELVRQGLGDLRKEISVQMEGEQGEGGGGGGERSIKPKSGRGRKRSTFLDILTDGLEGKA